MTIAYYSIYLIGLCHTINNYLTKLVIARLRATPQHTKV